MVAISLYRGNLHRVPDVPRRWLVPTPNISLKHFRALLRRRDRALSRLNSTTDTTATTYYPPDLEHERGDQHLEHKSSDELPIAGTEEGDGSEDEKLADKMDASAEDNSLVLKEESNQFDVNGVPREEKVVAPANQIVEVSNKEDATNDKENRKNEVEEKLKILNEKKHSLVQMLKQILNAEEELKRRMNVEGMSVRPPIPLQVDASNDSGSMTRIVTPKMGLDGNLGVDIEGGEADDASNSNMHSRHLLRMSSMSPSSDSPNRRTANNPILHSSRATPGAATGSPSRFAPTGQQSNPLNPPPISISGTNYIASSPSPAASGGTSVFRDARLSSPWS